MSTDFIWLLYAVVAAVAAVTDYRHQKIFNWLTLPAIIVAFAFAGFQGVGALGYAVNGFALATAVFLPLYALKVFGGGDVKLMMALGAMLGPRATLNLISVSLFIAAVGSVVLLVKQKRVRPFAHQMFLFFRSLFVRELEVQFPVLSKESRAPFGVAIFFGYLYVLVDHLNHRL